MQRHLFVLLCFVLITAGNSALAQRDLKDIPIPDPELERATFRLPEGFDVNLFAADPTIAKPIQMNFDEAGRLWVVSSEVYPHIKPGEAARDKVLVLEDLDGDGVSDRTNVFADGLLIPTGVAPGDGGVYVANSTQLLHFTDEDGDLKADHKRIVLSGFGTEDTHHILHTLRWGPDGYLYFNQSIYIHSHIETPWGVRRLNAGGIWQFRPESLELGVFMRGLVNTWGHHFDRYGQSFATDGAGGEGINYVVPGAYYFTAADAPQILHGLNPGSPKHCGLEIVETPQLPAEWQGSAITNDFRGHRVCRFQLTEDRSGFVSQEQQEVIWSDHVAFRPIDVKLGPDGAIYIADWYNPIIQHGEVDFRDPRRDHTHGRIWRVTWKGAPKRATVDLPSLPDDQLLQHLASDDGYRRQTVRQLVRQRGEAMLPHVDRLAQSLMSAERKDEKEALLLEALWCYQSLRRPNRALLEHTLQAKDGRIRAAAVRVLSHWQHEFHDVAQQWLAAAVQDEHPRVRLEAVRALSFSPNYESELMRAMADASQSQDVQQAASDPGRIETAMTALDKPTDTFLDYAIWLTARERAGQWLPAFRSGELDFDGNVTHLLTAFSAVNEGAPIDFLLQRVFEESATDDQQSQMVELIARSGNVEQVTQLASLAIQHEDAEILTEIVAESRRRRLNLNLPPQAYDSALKSESSALQQAGLRAAGLWQGQQAVADLLRTVADGDSSAGNRRAAIDGLLLANAVNALVQVVNNDRLPATMRKHGLATLSSVRPGQAATLAAKLIPQLTAQDHPEDLIGSFMTVKQGDQLLAEALASVELNQDVAREMLRVLRQSGQSSSVLEGALRKAGNIQSRQKLTAEQRQQLLKMAAEEVTAAEGEAVFRNPQLGCQKCHAIGGSGGLVGPDMVSLGGSAQPDYLLESLLDPNAKVKENYHTVVVVTTEGKLLSGIQIQQSKEAVTLRTAEDKTVTIATEDIEEIAPGVSLMPEGQVDTLTDRELAALVRFLSELGRTPEYTVSRIPQARSWTVMLPTDEAAYRLRRTSYATAATEDASFTWQNAYSTVAGGLPMTDIPQVVVRNRSAPGSRGVGFARTLLQVETAGVVQLKIRNVDGLELRVNQKPINLASSVGLEVTPGTHRLTFTVDHSQRSEPLEVELDIDQTTAVARFVN